MSDSARFLNALFGPYGGDLLVEQPNGENVETSDGAFLTSVPGLKVYPATVSGVHFIYALVDADVGIHEDCALTPTAVLHKNGKSLLFWRLIAPALFDELRHSGLLAFFELDSFDEAIPFPGTNEWVLDHTDENIEYSIAELQAAYLSPTASPAKAATHYGDALIMRPFDEIEPQYNQMMTVTLGARRESRNWKPKEMPIGALMAKLCLHEEGKKDGLSFVLADMVPGQRLKASVVAIYGIGLDIDTGTPSSVVDKAIDKLDCAAVRYTTHSHMKTRESFKKDRILKFDSNSDIDTNLMQRFVREVEKWDESIVETVEFIGIDHTEKGIVASIEFKPMPKHRVIVPLAMPYEIGKEGRTQQEAMQKWAKVPEALAGLMGVPFDRSCTDPSRLFYFARHSKGKPHESRIWGGPLFDYHRLDINNVFDNIATEITKGSSRSQTPEGQELGRWSIKRAHGFQIKDVIENFASDHIRGSAASQGITIECPFDEDHSNAGDQSDSACFAVNAGDGPSEIFTISCRHETCHNKTVLDMLGKMLKDGWFDKTVLEDEQFNAIIDDEEITSPDAKKIIREDKARDGYDAAIDKLSPDSTDDDIDAVLQQIYEAKLGSVKAGAALNRVKTATKASISDIRKQYKNLVRAIEKVRAEEEPQHKKSDDPLGRRIFRYENEFHFDEAWRVCDKALLSENAKAGLPIYSHIEGHPVRLNVNARSGRITFDKLEVVPLWASLNKLVTFVKKTDQSESPRQQVPIDVARQVHAQFYTDFPPAPEVVYTPIFIADGRLVSDPGYYYDPADPNFNFLLADTGFTVPPIPSEPTITEMQASLSWIKTEILGDFPFLDFDMQGRERREPSEANAIAMLLTPFMRRMINGCTPVFFISKPLPGTGGTLLGKIPILLFDGIEAPPIRYSQNEEEMNKVLVAALMETKSHLFFDDVKEFNSRELLRAITSQYVGGRVLGSSKNIERPNNFNWVATSNNPNVGNEMERRVVWIKLNLKKHDVQGRKFKHPLEEFLKQHRDIAVYHLLTLIQYWISVGMPRFTARSRASFEEWAQKVGGVLQVCGVEGFIDNRREAGQDMNEAAIKAFVREFIRKFGIDTYASPSDIYKWALDGELDIVEGANEDLKKAKFMRTLPTINERTFYIDEVDYMVRSGFDNDMNVAYFITKVVQEAQAA